MEATTVRTLVKLGDRAEIVAEKETFSGQIEEITDEGVRISWRFFEWRVVEDRQAQVVAQASAFVPHGDIRYVVTMR
jgi:hypothetical protein